MAEIPIGEYLFRRLKQMGIETAFGVPGGRNPLLFFHQPQVRLYLILIICN